MTGTILYLSDATAHGRAARHLAHELASRLAARALPLAGASRRDRRSARRLAAVAERAAATLLVVPVEDRRRLGSVLRGSLFAELVRLAACPVVLVPPGLVRADPPMLDGDHVLWAVADHRDAGCADVAAGMARGLGLPLTIAHVAPGDSDEIRLVGWLLEGLVECLAEQDPELAAVSSVRVSSGDPGRELRRLCDEAGPALAVLGSRGRGPLASAVLGSVFSHLARHGATLVVVCPPGARQPRGAAHVGAACSPAGSP